MKSLSSQKIITFFENYINEPKNFIENLARDFDEVGISYCIIGGVALGIHNYTRKTIDIDVLISKKHIH